MESIEKLRELAADINATEITDHLEVVGKCMFHAEWLDSWHEAFDDACEKIEREIAEGYMLLPLDAEGVPIHVGDTMTDGVKSRVVLAVSADSWQGDDSYYGYSPTSFRHVKPRTVEDVLHDFWEEWESHPIDTEWSLRLERLRESEAKYADELRELMGGDER